MSVCNIIAIGLAAVLFITLAVSILAMFVDVDKLNEETSKLDDEDDI